MLPAGCRFARPGAPLSQGEPGARDDHQSQQCGRWHGAAITTLATVTTAAAPPPAVEGRDAVPAGPARGPARAADPHHPDAGRDLDELYRADPVLHRQLVAGAVRGTGQLQDRDELLRLDRSGTAALLHGQHPVHGDRRRPRLAVRDVRGGRPAEWLSRARGATHTVPA